MKIETTSIQFDGLTIAHRPDSGVVVVSLTFAGEVRAEIVSHGYVDFKLGDCVSLTGFNGTYPLTTTTA